MRSTKTLLAVRLAAAGTVAVGALSAAAQTLPFRFEITPYAAYRIGGEFEAQSDPADADAGHARNLELHDGNAEGLLFDIRTSEGNSQWEALYARQSTQLQTQPSFALAPALDMNVSYFQFGGTYLFDDNSETTAPFIALTLGVSRFEPGLAEVDTEHYFSWSFGGGVQLRADRRIGVRLEARLFGSRIDGDGSLFCVVSPAVNACALAVEGSTLYQFETRVGLVARF